MPECKRRELSREISRSCRCDYREHVELLVRQLEKANSVRDHSRVARLTKGLSANRSNSAFAQPSRTANGTPISSSDIAMEEWAKFLENKFP